MTAGPHQFDPRRDPAWWVHTDQGVVLAGPFSCEAQARAGGNEVAAQLRAAMRRERYSERAITARVRALRIGFAVRTWPHGGIAIASPPAH